MEWTISVIYRGKRHFLKTTLEYRTGSLVGMRVYGINSSLLLETYYPCVKGSNQNEFSWRFKEGSANQSGPDIAKLYFDIFKSLEAILKTDISYFEQNKC